jgi:hypothetical protein
MSATPSKIDQASMTVGRCIMASTSRPQATPPSRCWKAYCMICFWVLEISKAVEPHQHTKIENGCDLLIVAKQSAGKRGSAAEAVMVRGSGVLGRFSN